MKQRSLFALMLVIGLSTGCSDGKKGHKALASEDMPEEEPLPERFENDDLPKAADELFDDFMYYFATNERLQRRRIAFPLTIVDEKRNEKSTVDEEQWKMEPFFTTDDSYTLIFDNSEQREALQDTTIDCTVVEKIFLEDDSVCQYAFKRNDGRWMLTGIRMQAMAVNPYAAFLNFYREFTKDSVFQRKSLSDEIAFTGPDPDDDFSTMEGFITPEAWDAFAPELPTDSIYNIVYGEQNASAKEKVLVICGISNGLETELTFQQKKGKWKLTKLTE